MSRTATIDTLREEIAKKEGEAKSLFAAAEKLRGDILASGKSAADILNDSDLFAKVDEAYRLADEAQDQVAQMQGKAARLSEIDGMGAKSAALSLYRGGSDRQLGDFKGVEYGYIADRLIKSKPWQGLIESRALENSQAPLPSIPLVEVLTKAELKALIERKTTITGSSATSAGPFIQNDLLPGLLVDYVRKTPTIANLVGTGQTNSDVVEYVSQSAPTNSAAETAETTVAAESVYPFATNTANVTEITHFVPVTRRAMADYGQISTIVEQQLVADLLDRLDTELASGNGSGQNFTGIYTASIQTQAKGGDDRFTALHKAITKIRTYAGFLGEPDAIGMHPNDWQGARLEQDANGTFLFGPPGMSGEKQIWGIPVVVSTVFTSGTPLVGSFRRGAMLWLREGVSVTTGYDGNDFTYRRVTVLASMRAAFAVIRPSAFCSVTGF